MCSHSVRQANKMLSLHDGRMTGSAHLETGLANVVAIVFFLSGVVFPFGCACTGEYKAYVVN